LNIIVIFIDILVSVSCNFIFPPYGPAAQRGPWPPHSWSF